MMVRFMPPWQEVRRFFKARRKRRSLLKRIDSITRCMLIAGIMSFLLLLTVTLSAQNKPASSKNLPADGDYMCKIDKSYKMRPCTIATTDGETILSIPEGLIGITATLYPIQDSKNQVFAEAHLTEERPFGCYYCNAECAANPESCVCKDIPRQASTQCMSQSINFVLTKKGTSWRGQLPLKMYSNIYKEGTPIDWKTEVAVFDIVIQPAKKK